MIKLDHTFSSEFTQAVVREYVRPVLLKNIKDFFQKNLAELDNDENYKSKIILLDILSIRNIHEITFADFSNLKDHILKIYSNLPMLSERYCPEIYFNFLKVDEELANSGAITSTNGQVLLDYKNTLTVDLAYFGRRNNSKLIPFILTRLSSATTPAAIRDVTKSVVKLKKGTLRRSNAMKSSFPDWVDDFENIFSYDSLSKKMGLKIVESIDSSVCLYCNEEKIEMVKGRRTYRPDLDHFYPKSKFPFLATSLYNLLPSGKRCNQDLKGSHISIDLISPYSGGVGNTALFDFTYADITNLEHDRLDVGVNPIASIQQNINLFEIGAVYNTPLNKGVACDLFERYEGIKELGHMHILDCPKSLKVYFDVDLNSSPKSEPLKKLKVDALNYISGKNYLFE